MLLWLFYYFFFIIGIPDMGLLGEMVDKMLPPWTQVRRWARMRKNGLHLKRRGEALGKKILAEHWEVLRKMNSRHRTSEGSQAQLGGVDPGKGSQSLVQKQHFILLNWNFESFTYLFPFVHWSNFAYALIIGQTFFLFILFLNFFPPMLPQFSPCLL